MPSSFASSNGPGRVEFVILISAIMMIVAFAIDSMLPALPAIGHGLGVGDATRWPLVISSFLFGFAIGQLFVGTLSDAYGRRGLMLWSIFGFAVANLAAALAPSFDHLLIARVVQGIGGAMVLPNSSSMRLFQITYYGKSSQKFKISNKNSNLKPFSKVYRSKIPLSKKIL